MASSDARDPGLRGRPVFFIRPPSVVRNELLGDLIRNEYQVAVLADNTRVRDLVSLHPGCILFLNLDEGWAEPEWEGFVREMNTLGEAERPRIGVLSYDSDPELAHKYLLELEVACGFIKLTLGLEESTKTILRVLEANDARGRRQYLRVPCPSGSATFNIRERDKVLQGRLIDLSSVGMACVFDDDPEFVVRTLLQGLQLKLKGVLCLVSAIVMGTRPRDDGSVLYVLLFDPQTPEETREKIRDFQRKALQANLEQDLG